MPNTMGYISYCKWFAIIEPDMTKPTKWVCAQQRLRSAWASDQPVWPESSLSAWRKIRSLATHWAHSEDSDQTRRMPRLIWVFAGRTLIFSSPEPKAHWRAYTIGRPLSSVVRRLTSTLFKHLLLRNDWANQSQISYGASSGQGNESLFK